MALTYATAAELNTFLGSDLDPVPTKLDRWLAYASVLVRVATISGIYDTEETGAPSDADVLAAFRDATCAQVAAWIEADIDPTLGFGSVTGVPQSSGIGGASVNWGSDAQWQAKAASVVQLVPESLAYLAELPRGVYVWG